MGPGRSGETEETSGLTYPSPGAEAIDSGPFYHSASRDGHADQQEQPGQGHGVQQTHMTPRQANTPPHHEPRPANLEELRLAAQLGQGLASASMLPTAGAQINVEDPNLRSLMSHADAGPDHHDAPSYAGEPTSAEAMAQHPMPLPIPPPPPPQYSMSMTDGIPPRKRSKVSRACDTCRRKKIKCDAQIDTSGTPCSSCARSKEPCLFSRVPQKRGPSKGYIKELADRINSIENKLGPDGNLTQEDIDGFFSTDRPRHSNGPEDSTRKRPFSSISTGQVAMPPNGVRPPLWSSLLQQPSGPGEGHGQNDGNSSLAPQPAPFTVELPTANGTSEAADVDLPNEGETVELDEQAYHDFLGSVQPVYPILPTDKARLQQLLSQAVPAVRNAFNLALPSVGQTASGDAKIASSILHEWESTDTPRNRATVIVHAQALLMLIIDADWRATTARPFLLARGVALANSMAIWKLPSPDAISSHDSDDQLCTRLWWSLVLMDRWLAVGTSQFPYIPERSVVIPAGLENAIGEVAFYLLRLSKLLNRICFVFATLQAGAIAADAALAALLADYIEDYRENLPPHIDAAAYPMVHLAFWHCRLIVTMLTPGVTPLEMMGPTKELSQLLSVSAELKSPLINHFVSLASMVLRELAKADGTQEEASLIIKDIVDTPNGGHWDAVKDKLAERLRPTSSSARYELDIQGLQHLADLATAHEVEDVPMTSTLATGYLDAAT